jgi:hypothetical protein
MSAENLICYNNIISNDGYGIQLDRCMGDGEQNIIHHNNFFDNKGEEGQVCEWGSPLNYWNNSYPSGGNFWDDYTGEDKYHGSNQDIPGSDGLGDTPYDIPDGSNQDNYPLMEPWQEKNDPPKTPNLEKIKHCRIYKPCCINISTTDPDDDNIHFLLDWGDGIISGWLGPYDSGEIVQLCHIYQKIGLYAIKAKAKDFFGAESDWSDPLSISVSKNRQESIFRFQQFFQRFLLRENLYLYLLRV